MTLAEYEAMGDEVVEGHSNKSAAIRHLCRTVRALCEELTSADSYEEHEEAIVLMADEFLAETEDDTR
jgi:hypothetical protein